MSALGRPHNVREPGRERRAPLVGAALVFKRRMRGRRARRDLGEAFALLAFTLFAADLLRRWLMVAPEYSGDSPSAFAGWFAMSMIALAIVVPIWSCALGALAAPARSEFEATQAALLTTLKPFDIVAGRLAAALWPVTSAVGLSLVIWLSLQLAFRFWNGPADGFAPIVDAHVIVLITSLTFGALAMLIALRRRPGRSLVRGFGGAFAAFVLSVTALVLVNPIMAARQDPTKAIEALLTFNPVATANTALNLDLLRTEWLYDHSVAPQFPFTYPNPILSTWIYVTIAIAALLLSAARLRRAYR